MENIISRIMEVEKKCSEEVRQAEQESAGRIEAHIREIAEKKNREFSLITAAATARVSQAIEEAKKRTDAETSTAVDEDERLYQDPVLHEEIKEKIISLLLAT